MSKTLKSAPSTRIEHDSLGNVEVPSQALYGAQTYRALQNYPISGRTAHPALIRAYLHLKSAAAQANEKAKVLDPKLSMAIQESIKELLSKEHEWKDIFPVDPYQAGAGTSQNMNMNEVIANHANLKLGHALGTYLPIHPNDHVNRSQSTNDTFPTAMRLAILDASRHLAHALKNLSKAFEQKAQEFKMILKSGRTHLQDAVPMTLGQEFLAYSLTLKKLIHWIEASREALKELGIGGSAAGTGLTVPPTYGKDIVESLEQLTQEKLQLAQHLPEAMQSQASVAYYASMLRISALELTRICNDLRLLASGPQTGLSEIYLPSVQPGSSIMPGKVNPSILEMVNQTMFSVLGFDQTIAYCLQAGQLELNVMMPMMVYSALEATEVATQAIQVLEKKCVSGIQPNHENLQKYFESTPQVATALSPLLGYEKTAELVSNSLKQGKTILALVREQKLIPEKELAALLDAKKLTGMR